MLSFNMADGLSWATNFVPVPEWELFGISVNKVKRTFVKELTSLIDYPYTYKSTISIL